VCVCVLTVCVGVCECVRVCMWAGAPASVCVRACTLHCATPHYHSQQCVTTQLHSLCASARHHDNKHPACMYVCWSHRNRCVCMRQTATSSNRQTQTSACQLTVVRWELWCVAMRMCVCVCWYLYLGLCVRLQARSVCVCVCVCMRVYVRERECMCVCGLVC